MLHIVHLIERRHGQGSGMARILTRLLLASFAVLLLGAGLLLSGTTRAQEAPLPAADASTLAIQLLDHLDAGEYAQAEAMFNATMAQAVPAEKLKAVWESLPTQAGEAQGRGEATSVKQGEMTLVKIPLHYAKAALVAKIAIDAEAKISGFLIQPEEAPPAAAVTEDAPYTETDLSVGEGERALPGTLTMPKGVAQASNKLVPAVVLVHGSGPHDRDESIGPNKPFMDIARGLAAQGVAVLRYEKRTKARPQDFASGVFGVDEETTNDAVLAVDALRKVEGIDPARVFVLGHSQGGLMAPRIAAVSGHVAGLVLMAAPARPLLDILIEQNRRLAVLDDGKTSDTERDAINALLQQVATTRDVATDTTTKTVMGMPAGYWRSIDTVDPVAEAKSVDLPMLLLQGARDIQVVDADWQRWRGGFHDNPKVEFKLYDKLNHLGIAGEGEGSIAEYANPGHVDAQLIDDVATWVKAH
ncbi:alpha/beta fold hydrolase [Thermomonas sp.]|uniref:alpha/beta hydrolase n=1 Tax=Thermomonas sp. TaxID=1971895 RepID=UPI002488A20C|nr:alpha/beta fold hydrolase [Thermomonas sp.]MDI1251951.1 alpha/beta fold hydrolase [Thermomonas sp.]